jgi:hypothetical protein
VLPPTKHNGDTGGSVRDQVIIMFQKGLLQNQHQTMLLDGHLNLIEVHI